MTGELIGLFLFVSRLPAPVSSSARATVITVDISGFFLDLGISALDRHRDPPDPPQIYWKPRFLSGYLNLRASSCHDDTMDCSTWVYSRAELQIKYRRSENWSVKMLWCSTRCLSIRSDWVVFLPRLCSLTGSVCWQLQKSHYSLPGRRLQKTTVHSDLNTRAALTRRTL